jgi:hypothetical protein
MLRTLHTLLAELFIGEHVTPLDSDDEPLHRDCDGVDDDNIDSTADDYEGNDTATSGGSVIGPSQYGDPNQENLMFHKAMHSEIVPNDYFLGDKETRQEIKQRDGLTWEYDRPLKNPNGSVERKTSIKDEYTHDFETPIQSAMTYWPYLFWDIHLFHTNENAEKRAQDNENARMVYGYKWEKPFEFSELMVFYGIQWKMTLNPTPGMSYQDLFKDPELSLDKLPSSA